MTSTRWGFDFLGGGGLVSASCHCFYFDPRRLIIYDAEHSVEEELWFCIGDVKGQVLTVRFTYRGAHYRTLS